MRENLNKMKGVTRREALKLVAVGAADLALFGFKIPNESSKPNGITYQLFSGSDEETAEAVEKIVNSGIATVSSDLPWYRFEPEQGKYNAEAFKRLDWVVSELSKNNIKFSFMLMGTPHWATQVPVPEYIKTWADNPKKKDWWQAHLGIQRSAPNSDAFAGFTDQILNYLPLGGKDRLTIYNEVLSLVPTIEDFIGQIGYEGLPFWVGNLDQYIDTLKAGYKIVKIRNKDIPVYAAALPCWVDKNHYFNPFLYGLFSYAPSGVSKFCDGTSFNVYPMNYSFTEPGEVSSDILGRINLAVKESGWKKKLTISEFGISKEQISDDKRRAGFMKQVIADFDSRGFPVNVWNYHNQMGGSNGTNFEAMEWKYSIDPSFF